MSQNRTLLASYINGVKTPRNFCLNPNAQFNKANITDTNNIVTRDTSTVLDGNASYLIDANSSGHFAAFLAAPFTKGTQGQNCEASFDYRGDASLYRAYVQMDSTVASAQQTLLNVTSGTQTVILNFPCGVSDVAVPSLVIESLSASAAAFNMGNIYIGKATNVGDAAQATFVGGMVQLGAAGCNYSESTSSGRTNFVDLGAGSGCLPWTVTSNGPGTISAVGTNDHRLTYTNMPAGNYKISLTGTFRLSNIGGGCWFRLNDGTNSYQSQAVASSGGTMNSPTLNFDVTYNTPGTRTFKIQASDDHGGSCFIENGLDNTNELSWKIYRFPSTSEQVFRVGAPGIGYTSYTPSFTGLGSPTAIDMSYQCVAPDLIRIYGRFTTGTPSATTAAISLPTGFTTRTFTSGNRAAGRWWRNDGGGNSNKSGSIIQVSGGTVLNFGFDEFAPAASPFSGQNGDTIFAAGQITSVDTLVPITDSSPCPRTSMPLLSQAVTTGSSGVERIERATVSPLCSSSPCTIARQSSPWLTSITRTSTGLYTANFAAGIFSAPPSCVTSCFDSNNPTTAGCAAANDVGTNTMVILTRRTDNTLVDQGFNIICVGPR